MYQIDFSSPTHVHFIGVGGCSMSGLAELMADRGFTVSGSDRTQNAACARLSQQGIRIFYGQCAENIQPDTGLVVYTAAIHEDNEELAAARAAGIPLLTRAEFLGQLMLQYKDAIGVAGTHGKTTTSSMLSTIFLEAGLDPAISLGTVLEPFGSSARAGHSDHFIVEACEYTNSFLHFYPRHEIVLNIEAEHLDFFKDIDEIRHSFRLFMEKLSKGGHLVIQGDIDKLDELIEGLTADITTYGLEGTGKTYDYWACGITYDENDFGSYDLMRGNTRIAHITLHVVGEHNISNSVAAAAMADLLGVPVPAIISALHHFGGAKRRFEKKGVKNGVTVVDDYAHHPSEIKATLTAAKHYPHRELWCVFQPHTYSRTKQFFEDFISALSLADKIVLADIYASRESDPGDISSRDLAEKLKKSGKEVYYFPDFEEIEKFLLSNCKHGDLLITMGAGDIVNVGEAILKN
ncbi:MAG: UDP-N-acetylmuramate--L-alanine ligase [Lachnospiraceae bacterium]|nr:UDP-N-acetylmuramate--L-alanine ligase [Lachnospiraceae bacterium]